MEVYAGPRVARIIVRRAYIFPYRHRTRHIADYYRCWHEHPPFPRLRLRKNQAWSIHGSPQEKGSGEEVDKHFQWPVKAGRGTGGSLPSFLPCPAGWQKSFANDPAFSRSTLFAED